MDLAQEEAERAENMLLHEDEIAARPARTWYVALSSHSAFPFSVCLLPSSIILHSSLYIP